MNIKDEKELKQPFTKDELKDIFAAIKSSASKESSAKYEAQLYNAYKPFLIKYAKKYKVRKDDAMDLYNDVFSKFYNAVWDGKQRPETFGVFVQNNLARECLHLYALKNSKMETKNESLTNPKIAMEASVVLARREKENDINRQSVLLVVSILDEIEHDEELRKMYNITINQIQVVRDYHGINSTNTTHSIEDLAKKYQKSELEIKGLLNSGMKQIRKIEEFDAIKTR